MALSVTEKSRPRTIKVWLANVAKCFDRLELSQTRKTEFLSHVLSANISFGQATAWRLSSRPLYWQKRKARAEADTLDRAGRIIESRIFRPTLKGSPIHYARALQIAAPLGRPSPAGSLPALGTDQDETLILGALDFLRKLATVLREIEPAAL